jgi:O-6-methylguanine DNA methyltransferase
MSLVGVSEIGYDVDGWGTGLLWFADELLVWHELPRPRPADPAALGAPQPTTRFDRNEKAMSRVKRNRAETVTILPQLLRRLRRYFAGEQVGFEDVEIDLDWCTTFQRAVAETLRGVPHGEIVTYGELAALAGHPNAQRAAGTFCAHNRVPIVIPCHRVVAAGGLGSYGSLGAGFKRRLLALEGVEL